MALRLAPLLLALFLLAAPLAAEAQRAATIARIAFISTTSPGDSPATAAFLQGLRELGYVEDQNIAIEWRSAKGGADRPPELAAELAVSGPRNAFPPLHGRGFWNPLPKPVG